MNKPAGFPGMDTCGSCPMDDMVPLKFNFSIEQHLLWQWLFVNPIQPRPADQCNCVVDVFLCAFGAQARRNVSWAKHF
tara:strand:- start:2640 stop:2873 length:234 start_codon:yes stop_codon:yes gene_type:complete